MKKITLLKPLENISEINLDLNKIDGAAILDCERQCRMLGEVSPDVQFSKTFSALLAAKASGVIYDDIRRLSGPDFMYVLNTISNFLFGGISLEPETSGSSEKQS